MSAFTTIARAFKGGLAPKPARGYLIPLDGFKGDTVIEDQTRSFQYFPATISDSQATNYQTKVIPGLSHPLYQWTSGGARTIAFEAIFTRDRTYTESELAALKKGAVKAAFAYVISGDNYAGLNIAQNDDPRNVDIPSAVAWLRSFLLPEYSTDGKGTFSSTPQRPRPPRKIILGLPGVRLNWGVPELPAEQVYVIMTGCEVAYEGFFHDGSPRIAKVALAFAEIIQVGGRIVVQDAGNKRRLGFGGYSLNDKSKGT
jgi:hypothetical protein